MATDNNEAVIPDLPVAPQVIDVDKDPYPPALPFPPGGRSDEIILPRWIYIQDREGRYLTVRPSPMNGTLTFVSRTPNLDCAFETERRGRNFFQLHTRNGNRVMGWDIANGVGGWYSADPMNPASTPTFTFIRARGNIVFLRDNFGPSYFMSNELRTNQPVGSPIAKNYLNENSEMEISIAAVRREIIDVQYDIPGGRVREAAPRVALSTTVRNDSTASDATQTLNYSYEKWSVGTWNNSTGIELGASSSFRAGIPFVFSSRFEISVTASATQEWGGEEGVREVVSSSTSVVVPPRRRARVQVIVRNAQIDVGFTYTERILWSNGQNQDRRQTGIYTNVDSWHVDVEITDWEDI